MQIRIETNAGEIAARLGTFPDILKGQLFDAMGRALDGMQYYAVDFMYSNFKAPTGNLEGKFYQVIEDTGSGVDGSLVNPESYAWRREAGFSGMTDSLGRFYAYDPGIAYMDNTLTAQTSVAEGIFTDAIGQAIMEI
jgi:hypothetical protein